MNQHYQLVGTGIGPANLSLSALLTKVPNLTANFFDAKPKFSWHSGLLFNDTSIQVSFLKDLVTLVDPTNPYSFIAFLAQQKRLYRFINVRFEFTLRAEFNQYFQWVSESLTNLNFSEQIKSIDFYKHRFVIDTEHRQISSDNIVLGTGLTPVLPECTRPYLGKNIFHSHYLRQQKLDYSAQRVVIIGGGQSAAEVVRQLLADTRNLPQQITWITRRPHLLPVDYSTFVTEIFFPNQVDHFYSLTAAQKQSVLQQQRLASDGIAENTLQEIYQKLYVLEHLEGRGKIVNFLFQSELVKISSATNNYLLAIKDALTNEIKHINADIVVLCTGYQWVLPSYLSPLKHRIKFVNNRYVVNKDYSIEWDGPREHKIYVQNAAKHSHGIADPNLSLMAWRSARIINSLTRSQVYDIEDCDAAIALNHISSSVGQVA